jgi:enterobactin synthetase component D
MVAPARTLRALGIDSEVVFDEAALREAGPLVFVADERRWLRPECEAEDATLIFSAKESLFKCVNPCTGVFFEFADARVTRIVRERPGEGTLELCLLRDLADGFPRGRTFTGRHALAYGHVHTTVWLPS